MDEEIFVPRGALEEQLVALHDGKIVEGEFLDFLLNQEIFVPVKDDTAGGIQGLQRSSQAVPLVVEAEGGVSVVLVFSGPDRAKPILADFEGFGGGILVDFSWLAERVGAGGGISLNPGWAYGIDIEPEIVAQMAAEIQAAKAG